MSLFNPDYSSWSNVNSGELSDRYALELFESISAEHPEGAAGEKARALELSYAAESRAQAQKEADRAQRARRLTDAIHSGGLSNDDVSNRDKVLAFVYSVPQQITKATRLASLGDITGARTIVSNVDTTISENFSLINGMADERFKDLGVAGQTIQSNAKMLVGGDLWANITFDSAGNQVSVREAVGEESPFSVLQQARLLGKNSGQAASELYKKDSDFRSFYNVLSDSDESTGQPTDDSAKFNKQQTMYRFIQDITTKDAEGSSIYGQAYKTLGSYATQAAMAAAKLSSETGDMTDVFSMITTVASNLPNKSVDQAVNQISSLISLLSNNDATKVLVGTPADKLKIHAGIKHVAEAFSAAGNQLDVSNTSFQQAFLKGMAAMKRLEAAGLNPYQLSRKSGQSFNQQFAQYVLSSANGMVNDPKNIITASAGLDDTLKRNITGAAKNYYTTNLEQPLGQNDPLTSGVQDIFYRHTMNEQITHGLTVPEAMGRAVTLEKDPKDVNGASLKTSPLVADLVDLFAGHGFIDLDVCKSLAFATVKRYKENNGKVNIETVAREYADELEAQVKNFKDARDDKVVAALQRHQSAIRIFMNANYKPEAQVYKNILIGHYTDMGELSQAEAKDLAQRQAYTIETGAANGMDVWKEVEKCLDLAILYSVTPNGIVVRGNSFGSLSQACQEYNKHNKNHPLDEDEFKTYQRNLKAQYLSQRQARSAPQGTAAAVAAEIDKQSTSGTGANQRNH